MGTAVDNPTACGALVGWLPDFVGWSPFQVAMT